MALKEKSTQLSFSIWKDTKRPSELDCSSLHVTLVEMKFVQTLHNLVAMSSISYSWGDTPWPSHNINVVLVLKGYVRATKSHNIIPRCQNFLIKNENAIGSMKNAKRLSIYGAQLLIPQHKVFFPFCEGGGVGYLCSQRVHIKFSMGSQHVPQVFNMFPILSPIAPHFIPYPLPYVVTAQRRRLQLIYFGTIQSLI
jgi:hypothetical protein